MNDVTPMPQPAPAGRGTQPDPPERLRQLWQQGHRPAVRELSWLPRRSRRRPGAFCIARRANSQTGKKKAPRKNPRGKFHTQGGEVS